MRKLQIIVLNTNLMRRHENDQEARDQWKWLEKEIKKFQTSNKTVSFSFSCLIIKSSLYDCTLKDSILKQNRKYDHYFFNKIMAYNSGALNIYFL